MENILEKARELGQLIKESPEMQRMNAAEAAFEQDAALQALIDEYQAQERAALVSTDEAFTEAIDKRMQELYAQIDAHPVYAEYIAAQTEVNRLMNLVNSEINFVITGRRDSCSGSCESCAGCH